MAQTTLTNSAIRAWIAPAYSQLARTYDAAMGLPFLRGTQKAFEYLLRRHGIRFGSAADIGCGTGLFACYLSRCWDVPVFAVDRSSEMLRVARRNCPGENICFLQQDIRCLNLPQCVDLITANFDTLNHLLTPQDLQLAFCRIAENLRPQGYLLFDLITPCLPLGSNGVYVRRLRGRGCRVLQRIHWFARQRILSIFIFLRPLGSLIPTVELHRERAYSPAEVGRFLLKTGFVIRGVHDAMTLGPAYTCPPRIIVVAQKRPCIQTAKEGG